MVKKKRIKMLQWARKSADLSLTETLWGDLKKAVCIMGQIPPQ